MLPILTSESDVNAIVGYLRTKPTGASIEEAKAVIDEKVLDHRKISAIESWGIIKKNNGKFLLTDEKGWILARNPEKKNSVYKLILNETVPYQSILEWAYHQSVEIITNVDVAARWHEHNSDTIGSSNENTIKNQAVCCFRICEAAGLGELKLGRKGQATRLIINRPALKTFIDESSDRSFEYTADDEVDESITSMDEHIDSVITADELTAASSTSPTKVFISHGDNQNLVNQVETMMKVSELDFEVAVEEETTAIPVPEKVFSAMRRCNAGVIIVSVDEDHKDSEGNYSINNNVLIEIGAAFVLYNKRVVLLWDDRIQVPSNLQGLYRCTFEGDEFSWATGMKLMETVKGFKDISEGEEDN